MINLTCPTTEPPEFFDLFRQVSDAVQAFENKPTVDIFQDAGVGRLSHALAAEFRANPDALAPLPAPQTDKHFFNA